MNGELITTTGGSVAELRPARTTPASQNPALVYLAGLASGSRRTMRQALDVIAGELTGGTCNAETCPWGTLRFQHTAAIRAWLAERYAAATANKMLAALRGVLKAAWRLGQMTAEEHARACDLDPVRGSGLPKGRALTSGEMRALFGACADDPTPAGRRDAALLAILYGAGLRRSEAAALALADYDPTNGALTVRHGKGNKERLVYATNGGKAAIDDWLEIRGQDPGALFGAVNRGHRMSTEPMTDQAVYNILSKRAAEAAVKTFSPHDLRRTFISDLLGAGADISAVQGLAGHANVNTTQRYDRRGEQAKVKAAELLHVPYEAPRKLV
jgi:site-specific recombinase XerD